ncbi:MAG TPA: hemerythrin domain-containing protein [Candidatus Dormibacteraeota bacterium]|nr:hemerythrin domain-containing protein [Candidatus Dormibacteraeota bacterium]
MNAVDLLTKDHRAVEDLFAQFDASEPEGRGDILAQIIRELSVHAAIEEAHLYPLIEKEVPGGRSLVREAIDEHQTVKEVLGRLDSKVDKAHTKAVAEMVGRLQRDVEHHVTEEEGEVFPKLEESVTKTRLEDVGRELRKAKETAPTRPHPNQPPATELTGKANAILDKARDKASGRT